VIDVRPELLDPDAPVHPPAGMTVAECLAYRARLREQQRQEGLAELAARRAGRLTSRAVLAAEERARHRIAAAEDRREGRTDPR
jgi:hypothetical protein